jgi:hypothetical protein
MHSCLSLVPSPAPVWSFGGARVTHGDIVAHHTCVTPLAGVQVLGDIPVGFLGFENPIKGFDQATQSAIMTNAITLALVGYMEAMSIASVGTCMPHRTAPEALSGRGMCAATAVGAVGCAAEIRY